MQFGTALAIVALVCAVLCLNTRARVLAIIAVLVAGLELALAFRVVTFGISGISVPLILGGALTVLGALLFLRNEAKTQVAAASVMTTVGLIQLLGALRILKV